MFGGGGGAAMEGGEQTRRLGVEPDVWEEWPGVINVEVNLSFYQVLS